MTNFNRNLNEWGIKARELRSKYGIAASLLTQVAGLPRLYIYYHREDSINDQLRLAYTVLLSHLVNDDCIAAIRSHWPKIDTTNKQARIKRANDLAQYIKEKGLK